MNLLWTAYRSAAPMLEAVAPAARWLTPAAERESWDERLGGVERPGGVQAWIHAASMGEALAAEALVGELARVQPAARLQLTATTRSGRTRLRRIESHASLAPFDTPRAIARFLAGVRPRRLFVIETELWFQWLIALRAARVPMALVSARLSERSVSSYRRFGTPLSRLIGEVAAVLCQSEADAERWRSLGATAARTAVVGNLKNDALPSPVPDRAAARAALGLDPDRPLLVLGSVRPGEIAPLAAAVAALTPAIRGRWQVVAVPRHPHASERLRSEAHRAGQSLVTDGAPRDGAWRWDERLGVLTRYYQAAEVAFVGGSLRRYGGHNPLEPAACGCAVIIGPEHLSQREGVRQLAARDAVWVAGAGPPLVTALRTLLVDEDARRARADAALVVVAETRGAARRAVARLGEWDLWPVA